MTDIIEKINAVLDTVFDHHYNSMPEFAEDEEPETYAAWFVREKPANFASGIHLAKSYWVSVSIITSSYDRTLYRQNEKAFTDNGFIYSGGSDISGFESSSPYPHKYRYQQEFLIDTEV